MADVSLAYEYNFWPYGTGRDYRGAQRLTPFLFGGIGATSVSGGQKSVFTANIPLGIGVKYKLGDRVNLGLEWAMHFSLSDELDGVKDPYTVKSSGMFKNKDCYSALMLSLTYSFMPKCKTCNKDDTRIPQHIAIIMDGNGRWASERGKERSFGHQAGVDTVRRITSECVRLGVKFLTLYTFSTENWSRPADEISALMGLVLSSLEDEIFMKNNVRFQVIGDMGRLPQEVQQKLRETMEHTAHNTAMTMVVALSYSSRWELTKAARELAQAVKAGTLQPEDIDENLIGGRLETAFMPAPELLIRTGGEVRVSNFLLWQIAYSELYFCDTYWPDFDEQDLHRAIASYQARQRRFGKTGGQIESGE